MAVAGRRCGPHSTMETGLVCGRCETPVCPRCVVATIVGTRCRGCAPKVGGPGSEPDETLLGFELSEVVRAGVTATVAVVALMAIGFAYAEGNRDQLIIRTIVFGGWLVSLTLHEFAHSLVAYLGGDREIKERGFLTLNPLKFMDPVWSVVAPLVLVMLGGLPLVGGRTLIDGHALRSRWWDTAVSAAGPATNLGIACLIAAAFKYGVIPDGAWSAGLPSWQCYRWRRPPSTSSRCPRSTATARWTPTSTRTRGSSPAALHPTVTSSLSGCSGSFPL